MSSITVPNHLLLPFVITLLIVIFMIFLRKTVFRNKKILWASLLVFFLIYLFLVGGALYEDIYLQWNLAKYDLNKNGFFEVNEMTPSQIELSQRLVNDVGRNFIIITGLLFSLGISVVVFLIGIVFEKYKKLKIIETK